MTRPKADSDPLLDATPIDNEGATVLVVGTGPAGTSAARRLAELGFKGRVVLFSDEMGESYDRTALSKQYLVDPRSLPSIFATPEARGDAIVHSGVSVEMVDIRSRFLRTDDGRDHGYDRLILCTGASPRALATPSGPQPGIHYLRTRQDADCLRESMRSGARMVIVGGGVIGLELASVAHARGCVVDVLEVADRVLARFSPPVIARAVTALHRSNGVRFHFEALVDDVYGRGNTLVVSIAGKSSIEADVVVVGVGASPRTDLASSAGLRVDDGIVVDNAGRTSDPSVFAAGDCACLTTEAGDRVRTESWLAAVRQGEAVAANIMGLDESLLGVPFTWSDQFDKTLQSIGRFVDVDETKVLIGSESDDILTLHFDSDALVGASRFCPADAVGRSMSAVRAILERGATVRSSLMPETSDLVEMSRYLVRTVRSSPAVP